MRCRVTAQRWALLAPVVAIASMALTAASPVALPPDSMVLTPGGVDLQSGTYRWDKMLLAMGDASAGGIEFRRIARSYARGESAGKMAQFNHNWDIRFRKITRSGGADLVVTSKELSYTFADNASSGLLSLTSNTAYATVNKTTNGSTATYTLTTADGTVVVSRPMAADGLALASSVTKANGVQYTLNYDNLGPSGSPRLRSVVSNGGYLLIFEYAPNNGTNAFVSKVCLVNLAATSMPASWTCPPSVPTVSYGYTGSILTSETDASNLTWIFSSTYSGQGSAFQETYTRPGQTSPYLTLNYDYVENFRTSIVSQALADGRNYEYGWSLITAGDDSNIALVPAFYKEDFGYINITADVYRYNVYSPPRVAPGPSVVTDSLNRTTNMDWCLQACAYAILKSKTLPSGMKANYSYDNFHNLIQTVISPAPGSNLAAIKTTANFDCSTMINCSKSNYEVDANGGRFDRSYSTIHGGLLSEASPADANGIRSVKRYAYVQRYAWIKSSGGGYVRASSPIWLLSQERTCRSTATTANAAGDSLGCAGGAADEVVTSYEYGPDDGSVGNNLWLRGVLVTAQDADGVIRSRRTCFGYDYSGKRIWETKPRAGLGGCQ